MMKMIFGYAGIFNEFQIINDVGIRIIFQISKTEKVLYGKKTK